MDQVQSIPSNKFFWNCKIMMLFFVFLFQKVTLLYYKIFVTNHKYFCSLTWLRLLSHNVEIKLLYDKKITKV